MKILEVSLINQKGIEWVTIYTFLFVNEKCTIYIYKKKYIYSMFQGFIFSIIIIKNNVF